MRKLIEGIVEFRRTVQEDYRELFGKLATGQSPDALFIACSDSRVVPNTFASTNPGDLFVIRNVGNLIPRCGHSDAAEGAAIEFSVQSLKVTNIIVCGHSECAAMRALISDRQKVSTPNLKNWLKHGDPALVRFKTGTALDNSLAEHNQLSQLNVLQQIEHLMSYPEVRKRVNEGTLSIHGWWFDISKADVYAYEDEVKRFVLIDEEEAERLMNRLEH